MWVGGVQGTMKISRGGMTSWLSKYRGRELRLLSHASGVFSVSKGPRGSTALAGSASKKNKIKKGKEKNIVL